MRSLRARLAALAVVLGVLLAGFIVVLLRSATPGCTVAVDRPALPASLTALGDFQQAYPAADVATLEDVAARAASAEDPRLIGLVPQAPATVAGNGARPATLVVPLREATGSQELVAQVVFEEDCAGDAVFEKVEDVPAPTPSASLASR